MKQIYLKLSEVEAVIVAAVFQADITRPTLLVAKLNELLPAVEEWRRLEIAREIKARVIGEEVAMNAREYIDHFHPGMQQTAKAAETAGRAIYPRPETK